MTSKQTAKRPPPVRAAIMWGVMLLTVQMAAYPVLAHTGADTAVAGADSSAFSIGLAHPISGWDHVAAMVAVGLWGAFLGVPAIWLLPVVFPMVMAVGSALGVVGLPLYGVETGIALSALVLGLAIAGQLRPPLWIAATAVALFAIFHGYAHGAELPAAAQPVAFAAGFVIATGLLHLAGIGLGLLIHWPPGRLAVRVAGGVIAIAGLAFLTGMA